MKKINWYFVFAIVFIILSYFLLSNYINKEIVLPKINSIIGYLKSQSFDEIWTNTKSTIIKAIVGYLVSMLIALFLAVISNYKHLGNFIKPFISIIKTVPTISIIIIALIWLGKEKSIFLIAYLVIFPILYEMFYYNIKNVDKKLLEVCKVYQFSFMKKIKYLYFYSILESFFLSLKQTFGLCFKVIVMAEVIGQVNLGIGAQIQNEKVNLEMAGVFTWTILLIVIVIIMDYLIEYGAKKVLKWK